MANLKGEDMGRRKRIADWLEKMSAAFFAGGVISEHGGFAAYFLGAICFAIYHCISQVKEISMIQLNMTMLWVTGITCIVIGLVAIYASYKGWLK